MEYKKLYSLEEVEQVKAWFRERWEKLPDDLHLDQATYMADLRHTLTLYFEIADTLRENPTYSPQVYLLFKVQRALQEGGLE